MAKRADYRILGKGMGGRCVEEILSHTPHPIGSPPPTIELVDDDALPDVDFVAVADNKLRQKFLNQMATAGRKAIALQHPLANWAGSCTLWYGSFIKAGAVVAERTEVERGAIVGEGAVICHDCRLGDCCHIQPGAVLCGAVEVDSRATVGPGCTVLGKVRIGHDAVIDSGLVIAMDVPAGTRVTKAWGSGKACIRAPGSHT